MDFQDFDGRSDYRHYSDGVRHLKAISGARLFFAAMMVIVTISLIFVLSPVSQVQAQDLGWAILHDYECGDISHDGWYGDATITWTFRVAIWGYEASIQVWGSNTWSNPNWRYKYWTWANNTKASFAIEEKIGTHTWYRHLQKTCTRSDV